MSKLLGPYQNRHIVFTNQNRTTIRDRTVRIATIDTDSYRWSHLVAAWMTTRIVRRANPASTWLTCRLLPQIRAAARMTRIWRKRHVLVVENTSLTPLSLACKRSLQLRTQLAFAWMMQGMTRGGSFAPQLSVSHLLFAWCFVCLNVLIYTLSGFLGKRCCLRLFVNIHVIVVYPSVVCVCVCVCVCVFVCVCLCVFVSSADVCLQS